MDFGRSDGLISAINTRDEILLIMEIGLYLKQQHYVSMLEDVVNRNPNEACGIVAGVGGYSDKVYSITNILNSPFLFRMNPEEQLIAMNDIEDLNLELLAIYHSHPIGPAAPSETDVKEFAYPDTKYLIWSLEHYRWVCHGYKIVNQCVIEVPLIILEEE